MGLLSGKMTGRSTCLAISRTISSVNEPGWVDAPMRTCGFTVLMVERRLEGGFDVEENSDSERAKDFWAGFRGVEVVRRPALSTSLSPCQSRFVSSSGDGAVMRRHCMRSLPDLLGCLLLGHPSLSSDRISNLICNSDPSGSSTKHHHAHV